MWGQNAEAGGLKGGAGEVMESSAFQVCRG